MLPAIFSLQGPRVTPEERALFASADPLGFILFARNIDTPDQVRALTDDLRDITGRACPILIDQEGGRVARMRPPYWPEFPAAATYGALYAENPDAAREKLAGDTAQIAEILTKAGINVNCAPVLDLRHAGAHDIIGDRSFAADPAVVADLADVVCRTYLDHGITPILKHAPGHGRARADSHLELPIVDVPFQELATSDFAPFRDVAARDYAPRIWMMTAHIVYPDLDPGYPATLSPRVIAEVMRGDIGFDGVIISDDMDMKALDPFGDIPARAHAMLAAGCDVVLNCHGRLQDMQVLADSGLPPLGDKALKRLAKSGFGGYDAAL